MAYFQLYEIQESQTIIQRNLTLFEALETLTLTKVANGKAAAADVLRVQLKIEELQQELIILESTKTNPKTTINQLLNRPLESPINITDSLSFATIPFNKDILTTDIEESHPMLRMFELQKEVSKKAISLNELSNKPSLGLGLDYILVSERSDAIPVNNGRDIFQLRASVKIPIYKEKYKAKQEE